MPSESELTCVQLRVNGETYKLLIKPAATLLEVLRDQLDLTGTKEGCGLGECGACTVLIDGKAAYSCITLVLDVRDKEITTIEGVAKDGLDPVQRGLWDAGGFQCGFCTPGKVMAAKSLFNEYPAQEIDADLVKQEMAGHLCRCTGYNKTLEGILWAAKHIAEGGE